MGKSDKKRGKKKKKLRTTTIQKNEKHKGKNKKKAQVPLGHLGPHRREHGGPISKIYATSMLTGTVKPLKGFLINITSQMGVSG